MTSLPQLPRERCPRGSPAYDGELQRIAGPHCQAVMIAFPAVRRRSVWRLTSSYARHFRLLQKNVLNRRWWQTRAGLRLAIVVWIGRTYHRRRPDALGRMIPIEFETLTRTAHAA